MIKVISANLNGIRAAARKGFFDWMKAQDPDIVCVQETKAQMHNLSDEVLYPEGYYSYFSDAEKKGYSGVGIYTKAKPINVIDQLGWDCPDKEGRYIQADFENLSVISLYLPSGTTGGPRQEVKFDFLDRYYPLLSKIQEQVKPFIICGDWNIVHKEIDIKNFQANQKTSGCLPEERAWIDRVFTQIGLVDAFRVLNQESHQYTWWSQRAKNARANNVGWRIDYQVVTPNLKDKIESVSIYKDENFSDHAPLIINYNCAF
jgi:exodeoxyribonuclease III